jgi:diguanylate cyclase (GGDEF)-like protein/putative nucleotidyltransferase with HDIG domain
VAADADTNPISYPPRLRRYTSAIIALSVPIAAGAILHAIAARHDARLALGVAVFTLAAILAETKPVPLDERGTRSVSLAFVFLLAGQVLFGWQYAVLAAVLAMSISQALERLPLRRAAFNVSAYAISAFVSAGPGFVLGWKGGDLATADTTRLTVLVFVAGACFVLANVALVAGAVALAESVPIREMLDDYVRHAGPAFAIMAFISALATALWQISATLELLLAGPLFALALYQRYAYRSLLATTAAETDGLTGLRNHRSFHASLREALDGDEPAPAALVVLDIDDFKGINDRFGHPVGDEVLRALADALRAVFDAESVFRVGGEEFAVLLADCDADAARNQVARLHADLAAHEFPHRERTTISAGIATYPTMAVGRDELVRLADDALYWAKDHGKARTCVYDPSIVRTRSVQEVAELAERQARLRAAESLIRVVDARDTYTGAHSEAVSRLGEGIARALDLDEELVAQIRLAGLLHDLGKIAIPDRILQKPAALDDEEAAVLRQHVEIGYRLLEGLGVSPIDQWIRHHHESWDGSGYPHGLAGEDIPLGSRIILVADAFDAMTTNRTYRAGGTRREAIAELRRCAWMQFDARVVAALEAHLAQADSAVGAVG